MPTRCTWPMGGTGRLPIAVAPPGVPPMSGGTPGRAEWLSDAGEDLRALLLDGLQRVRIQTEEAEDRWCHLSRLSPGMDPRGQDHSGRVDEQWHVPVTRVVPAVLGDLAAGGVNRADLDATEHVRIPRVRVRHAEEGGSLMTSVDLRKTGLRNLFGATVHAVVVVEHRRRAVVPEIVLAEVGRAPRLHPPV